MQPQLPAVLCLLSQQVLLLLGPWEVVQMVAESKAQPVGEAEREKEGTQVPAHPHRGTTPQFPLSSIS